MRSFAFALLIPCCLFLPSGCSNDSPTARRTSVAPADDSTRAVLPDDVTAVKAIEAVAGQTKTNADGHIVDINLRGSSADDATLVAITPLKYVKVLLLNDLEVSDTGLAALKNVDWPLVNLDLRGCAVSNAGINHISGFTSLRALRLSGSNGRTTVDDDAAVAVSKLTNLRVLSLDKLFFGADGIEQLLSLKNLQEIYLAETLVDDETLQLLPGFPCLKKLRLSRNQITDIGLRSLSVITGLTELDLSENSLLSDDGMVHLSGLSVLQKLNLWRVPIGDAGVRHLAPLVSLVWLNLDNTMLTNDGLPAISGFKQLSFLHLGSTLITNSGLPALHGLSDLDELIVSRTGVDDAGVATLRHFLPATKVQIKYLDY